MARLVLVAILSSRVEIALTALVAVQEYRQFKREDSILPYWRRFTALSVFALARWMHRVDKARFYAECAVTRDRFFCAKSGARQSKEVSS
jgi:hypothetical protein